mgnify:FL=1
MYNIFLDQLLLPVTPEEMKIKHNGRNDTITLINDGEVNILKTGGKSLSTACSQMSDTHLPCTWMRFIRHLIIWITSRHTWKTSSRSILS